MSNTFFDEDPRMPTEAELQAYVLKGKQLRAEAMQTWAADVRHKVAAAFHAAGHALFTPRRPTGLGTH